MRSAPFTRPTLIAAVEHLEQHSQARFNQRVLRLGLEDEISSSTALSVAARVWPGMAIFLSGTTMLGARHFAQPFQMRFSCHRQMTRSMSF